MSESDDIISVAKDIVDREMVIGPNDTEAVQKFFDHFDMKMPKGLKTSIDEFKEDPNLKTQKRLVIEVNKAITGKHSIEGLDEMFKPIVECAEETAYDLEFSDEMTDLLKEDVAKKSQTSSEPEEPSDS